jgi:hypothetical protein
MIVLYTDFSVQGPYVGQMKSVLQQRAPQHAVIDLMHDAPAFNPKASGYLLNALRHHLPLGSVILGVVDPGVGQVARRPVIVDADGCWYIGPDNGLFEIIVTTSTSVQCWEITWRPEHLSNSFHGRDLFAPVAAAIAQGQSLASVASPLTSLLLQHWPTDLAEIIYIDHYGNCMTGMRSNLSTDTIIRIAKNEFGFARTFTEVQEGKAFWYVNSIGLIALAINRGDFSRRYHCQLGQAIEMS